MKGDLNVTYYLEMDENEAMETLKFLKQFEKCRAIPETIKHIIVLLNELVPEE